MEVSDKALDVGAPTRVERVALGLDIDPAQTERILIDDAVNAAIVRQLGTRGGTVGAAISHPNEQVEHRLLEELRLVAMQPGEQRGDLRLDPGDAVLDLLDGVQHACRLGLGDFDDVEGLGRTVLRLPPARSRRCSSVIPSEWSASSLRPASVIR